MSTFYTALTADGYETQFQVNAVHYSTAPFVCEAPDNLIPRSCREFSLGMRLLLLLSLGNLIPRSCRPGNETSPALVLGEPPEPLSSDAGAAATRTADSIHLGRLSDRLRVLASPSQSCLGPSEHEWRAILPSLHILQQL